MNPILKQKNYREVKIFDLTSGRFALFSEMIYFEDGFRLAVKGGYYERGKQLSV